MFCGRLLAHKVIDPVDRLLIEHLVQGAALSRTCPGEVVAEGLLDDEPAALGDDRCRTEHLHHRPASRPAGPTGRPVAPFRPRSRARPLDQPAASSHPPVLRRTRGRSSTARRTHPNHRRGAPRRCCRSRGLTRTCRGAPSRAGRVPTRADDAEVLGHDPSTEQVEEARKQFAAARSPVAPNSTSARLEVAGPASRWGSGPAAFASPFPRRRRNDRLNCTRRHCTDLTGPGAAANRSHPPFACSAFECTPAGALRCR